LDCQKVLEGMAKSPCMVDDRKDSEMLHNFQPRRVIQVPLPFDASTWFCNEK
jgi:hypothetical protein